jgi:copper(I)-binding protein
METFMFALRHLPVLALALLSLSVSSASAKDYTLGPIKISTPWTRVTPTAATVAGGFMTITNTGAQPDTLVGGTATVSGRLEIHEMAMDGGVMKMRELKPGLVIKPGETITLKPGSFHVMFMELKEPIATGKTFKGTLVFEKAGTIEIEYAIEPFGTRTPGDGGQPMPAEATKKAH